MWKRREGNLNRQFPCSQFALKMVLLLRTEKICFLCGVERFAQVGIVVETAATAIFPGLCGLPFTGNEGKGCGMNSPQISQEAA